MASSRRRGFTTEEGVGTAGGPVVVCCWCGAWPGGELTAWQSVGTGEQSRAGSLGEHYHLLQDNPPAQHTWERLLAHHQVPGYLVLWGYLKYIKYLSWLVPETWNQEEEKHLLQDTGCTPNVGES